MRISKKAFCLNPSSAVIWKLCDGATAVPDIAAAAAKVVGGPIDETFVTFAVERFRKDHLLEPGYDNPADDELVTRAQLVKRIGRAGLAAAVAVPLVTAVMAPTAAKAYGDGRRPPPPKHWPWW